MERVEERRGPGGLYARRYTVRSGGTGRGRGEETEERATSACRAAQAEVDGQERLNLLSLSTSALACSLARSFRMFRSLTLALLFAVSCGRRRAVRVYENRQRRRFRQAAGPWAPSVPRERVQRRRAPAKSPS